MQVFKAYFKIVNKRKSALLVYFMVFLMISIIITTQLGGTSSQQFSQTKSRMAFFSAENTPLVQGLKDYLSKNAILVDIPDNEQIIQDELFYQQVNYVLRVPQGFTESFMNGSDAVLLQKKIVAGQVQEIYTDQLISRYLATARLYQANLPGTAQAQIARNVAINLEAQASVNMSTYGTQPDTNFISYYFQFVSYAIMAIVIMGVTSVMMTFNEADLQNRNVVSPVRQTNMNMQLFLGNLVFGVIVWAALCIMSFILYGKFAMNIGTLMLCLNAFAITVVSLCIGFLLGKFIQNAGALSAIINVLSLGLSLISGVFVPQDMLGKTVLTIASFMPNYWYVKAVNDLRDITVFSSQSIMPIVYDMLIQLGFAAAILIVALLVTKQRKLANAYS